VQSKAGDIVYKAQSQDEDALVIAASKLHMVFVGKNANLLEIRFNGSVIRYEVLEILEFTSDRKRMSVVVKDCQVFFVSSSLSRALKNSQNPSCLPA
jgi:phospholipid-translocating ATPase